MSTRASTSSTTATRASWTTFLSGGAGNSVTVHAGEIYVTGEKTGGGLPTTANAYQRSPSGTAGDAFVAVLNPSLPAAAQLLYATYLGGSKQARGATAATYATGIAVDSSDNVYVTGSTGYANFPTTAGAYQTTFPRGATGMTFVAKINPSASGPASLLYSTFVGAGGSTGIAVDGFGNAYVTGITNSSSFPTTTNAIQKSIGQATTSTFVTTLNASGSALLFSTYLGGTDRGNQTSAWGIALDGSGNIYVAGNVGSNGGTYPVNFPTTSGAVQTAYGGGTSDAFVAEISAVVSAGAVPAASIASAAPTTPLGGGDIQVHANSAKPEAVVNGSGSTITSGTSQPTASAPTTLASNVSTNAGNSAVSVQGMTGFSNTSIPSSNLLSTADQALANFTLLLNDARNAYESELSSVAVMWQSVDVLAVQRLDALLSMEAGAMGQSKDTLMHDLQFASAFSSNSV